MTRWFIWMLLVPAACGGKEQSDVDAGKDAGISDAFFDLNAHWGECCDFAQGGMTVSCSAAGRGDASGIGEGGIPFEQCFPEQYCGIVLTGYGKSPFAIQCCGQREPGATIPPSPEEWYDWCPPWPNGMNEHWGECCHLGPDKTGGVPGACADDNTKHVQCAPNQYCGADQVGMKGFTCCGNHDVDHGLSNASGIDPTCYPRPLKP